MTRGRFCDHLNNNLKTLGKVGGIAANAVLSGTVSELGGGKFANGAVTGAFSIMFNDMMHEIMYWTSVYRGKIKEIYINYKNTLNSYDTSESFYEDY